MRRLVLVVVLVATVGVSRADEKTDQAKQLFESATTHYKLSEFKEALTDYREAYRAKQDPVFLYDIAQCLRQLGQWEEALRNYRFYLSDVPQAPNKVAVQQRIAELEQRIRNTPPVGTIEPKTSTRAASTPKTIAPTESKTPEAKPSAPVWYRSPLGAVGLGGAVLGVVGIIAGGGVVGYGGSLQSQANQATTSGQRADLQGQATTASTAGYVTLGIGGALAVAGVVMVIVSVAVSRRVAPVATATIVPAPGGLALSF